MSDPDYGSFHVEDEETLDARLAEEEPDPSQDPDLFEADETDDPVAALPEPEEVLDPETDPEPDQ